MGGKLKKIGKSIESLNIFKSPDSPGQDIQQSQAPQESDSANAAVAAEERRRRQAAGGQNVLTSGSGASGRAFTAKKTLLG